MLTTAKVIGEDNQPARPLHALVINWRIDYSSWVSYFTTIPKFVFCTSCLPKRPTTRDLCY
jgi:hypothetical protein